MTPAHPAHAALPLPDVTLTVGEFSRVTYLSVKTLHHYHDIGLLPPASIDPANGYRRYAVDQVPTAQLIRRLRDLDMPIDDVRTVLEAPDPEAPATRRSRPTCGAWRSSSRRRSATVASLRTLLEHRSVPGDVVVPARARACHARGVADGWRSTTWRRGSTPRTRSCTTR